MSLIQKEFHYGSHLVRLQTGEIANQATAAVLTDVEGTVVLTTVVGVKKEKPEQDFLPLTVNYQERTYAAGKIPGGYLKREGRPSEKETLTSRLIDRSVRPLFPEGFTNEVQIVATVMSVNPDVSPDIVAMIGASAAIAISGIPFNGPIGAARIGYQDGQFLLNPSPKQLEQSALDLVVAGTEKAVLMVESEAGILSEATMLEAVWTGHLQLQAVITAIKEFAAEVGVKPWAWQPPIVNEALKSQLSEQFAESIQEAFQITDKQLRTAKIAELHEQALKTFLVEDQPNNISAVEIKNIFEKLQEHVVRNRILSGHPRIDGRDTRTVRPLSIKVGVLPRTHGSALFTRGETQAMVITTLGTTRDAQISDDLLGEKRDALLFHYNFPPYSTGETGMMGSPKRREIGHGNLARRGIKAILPTEKEFPYVLRVVSEITASNGSSSMASVCGASLSLMDAGVPTKAPVAGIAMGLIKEENKFAVLSDILGDEDFFGDMDFKVAGTENGITALQMDIKIDGITKHIMQKALEQAREGRLHILKHMNEVISVSRPEISEFAPRITTKKIPTDKIRDVIGKGGSTIRMLTENNGVNIDISDAGEVTIFATNNKTAENVWEKIKVIIGDIEVGTIYEGKITKLIDSGAFVNILPNKDGFLHISEVSGKRIENINDVLQEGQVVKVKVIDVDRNGRVRLSIKEAENA